MQSQTGQPADWFGDVIVKELVDNAFDAAESAGVAPRVRIGAEIDGDELRITVTDNGTWHSTRGPLGVTTPLIVEALGVRPEVTVSIDPGGRVAVDHEQTAGVHTSGAFAIRNPHAEIEHAHCAERRIHDFYKSTVGDGWLKPERLRARLVDLLNDKAAT